jgi:hypothetical protein
MRVWHRSAIILVREVDYFLGLNVKPILYTFQRYRNPSRASRNHHYTITPESQTENCYVQDRIFGAWVKLKPMKLGLGAVQHRPQADKPELCRFFSWESPTPCATWVLTGARIRLYPD